MKPTYEIVRADELQPDDVIALDIHSHSVHVDRLIKGGGLVTVYPSKDVLSHKQRVLRQLPPERNPDVLRKALRSAVDDGSSCNEYLDILSNGFINQAIRELESEAGDGVQD